MPTWPRCCGVVDWIAAEPSGRDLATSIWSASGYIAAFMRASNAIYEVGEGRPIWKTIPVRLGITLAMLILGLFTRWMRPL